MLYEAFRADMYGVLSPIVSQEELYNILEAIDSVAVKYSFSKKAVELSVVNGDPDILVEYIASKATENLKKQTLYNYYLYLKNMFLTIGKDYDKIEATDIRLYLTWYKNQHGISDRTKEQVRVYINSFYKWCMDEGKINRNPCVKINPIKYHKNQRYIIKQDELELIRFNCQTLREKAIVDILFASGLRVTELCDLKIEDINWTFKSIHVKHGKGDKERTTFFNSEALISLKAYLNSRTDDCPYVIVNERGKEKHRIGKKAIELEIHQVSDRAGLSTKKINPHNFRHTLATYLIGKGCPVEYVQMILGHSKISTTMIYARISEEEVRRNYERYSI